MSPNSPPPAPPLRVLLADDHDVSRKSVRLFLESLAGLEVVGEVEDGGSAVARALELAPDVVLMDVRMPARGGADATRAIVEALPEVMVIGLSLQDERAFVEAMLDAGACGYVLKDHLFEDLPAAVEAVISGAIYLSPALR